MALLLVADNPVQLRPSPWGFLKAHSPQTLASLLLIHKPGANKHHLHFFFFFSVLLWLGGKYVPLVVVFIQKIA